MKQITDSDGSPHVFTLARDEYGLRRMAVIAGVGVREYYRRFGYKLEETYMVKTLSA